jgi:hypothetical protein
MTVAILAGHISTNTGKRHRDQVADDVGAVETDSTIQFRKEGYYRITYTEQSTPYPHVTDSEELIGTDDIWISPLLGDFVVGDLPDNFAFGNGSTGPTRVTKSRDGVLTPVQIIVCCFPNGFVLTDAQKYRLQEIFEGIPPGTPS